MVNPYPSCPHMCPLAGSASNAQFMANVKHKGLRTSLCRGLGKRQGKGAVDCVLYIAALEGLSEGAASSPESHAVVRDGYLKQAILSRVKNSMGSGEG